MLAENERKGSLNVEGMKQVEDEQEVDEKRLIVAAN